jgi:curved DNA-binding protein CbpA
MKIHSKYFDSIRVKPDTEPVSPTEAPTCQWKGCAAAGVHRAPKGRGYEGEYYLFCLEHVRNYNASYNYFEGMSNAQVEEFQKDAVTGHRPTWKAGANAWAHGTRHGASSSEAAFGRRAAGTSHAFFAWHARNTNNHTARRKLRPLELRALETMHLDCRATGEAIKARFKELVKLHHPDANGGDTRSEDKLREIIQAYTYLKQAGLV